MTQCLISYFENNLLKSPSFSVFQQVALDLLQFLFPSLLSAKMEIQQAEHHKAHHQKYVNLFDMQEFRVINDTPF